MTEADYRPAAALPPMSAGVCHEAPAGALLSINDVVIVRQDGSHRWWSKSRRCWCAGVDEERVAVRTLAKGLTEHDLSLIAADSMPEMVAEILGDLRAAQRRCDSAGLLVGPPPEETP